ncbi:ABC transporter ATP-binding protein [Sinomicrobium weinanense]|uniref:ABC transporter ATP-binding protein n=1 Tax=Sinomicrobium weinanense TaxID=2842200 RepID=A0A926Q2M4_9FLAO|nr:ABC transporter ATP-binding protein [Sinomicrobium weinanense]MBC9795086.1 ABC transporter ATP-binding protein [Sinomicrobium weinanense]MBU3123783.1 ABC transporter ATP-binding protein [Sinomicrobium weinanense]
MNILSISNLIKTYPNGVKAIHNISLEIGNGMFGLLGPNGAGKSSLMKTIAGLQKADDGEILFNGEDVLKNPLSIKRHLGFLPQDFGVYPKVSARDLLNHLAILKGITSKNERKVQINELLNRVNLYNQRNREVHTFSGGMKQRFGVAQALLGNPKIIIVDEPTAGLDPEERNRLNLLLSEISINRIVILSTHLVEDVKNLCAQMAIIKNGMLLCMGAPSELMRGIENKVWQKAVTQAEFKEYKAGDHFINYEFRQGEIRVNIFSEQQPEGFTRAPATLEHIYFHQLNTNPAQ